MLPNIKQQNEMARLAKLIELSQPKYLKDDNSDNYKFIIQKILWLALGNTKVNGVDMKQLLVESGLYSVVAWAYKETIGKCKDIFMDDLQKWVNSLIATWKAWWKMVKDGEGKTMVALPSSSFFESIVDGKTVYTEVTIYDKSKKSDTKELYAFTRTFYAGKNECKLYKMKGISLEDAKEVNLDALPETAKITPVEETGLSVPAFIVNTDSARIFEKIQTLVDSVDRKTVEIELEFHKHLDAITIFKNITIPESAIDKTTGKIIKEKMGKMFMSNDENADVIFRANANPMIDQASTHIDRDIRRVSALSYVPIEYFGLDTNDGAIGSESRAQKNAIYFAKIENMREMISEAFNTLTWWVINFSPIVWYEQTSTANGNNNNGWAGATA